LDKPAKILIGGIFAGALVYGLGEMNTFRLERKVHRASEGVCRRNGSSSEEARDPFRVDQHVFRKSAM